MSSWLHEQRLVAVLDAVRDSGARSLLDLGCGDGDFLVRALADPRIERIVGVDLSARSLDRMRARLGRIPEARAAAVRLVHHSILDPIEGLSGFDCAVLVETIEHIDPGRLSALERAVFVAMRPRVVIVTTPNAEFNSLLGVPPHRYRHPEHRFEWDRNTFRRWAGGVARRHGCTASCSDIAGRHAVFGGASQMAVFQRTPQTQGP